MFLQTVIIVVAVDSFPETMQSGNVSSTMSGNHFVRYSPKTVGALLEGHEICIDEDCKVCRSENAYHNTTQTNN